MAQLGSTTVSGTLGVSGNATIGGGVTATTFGTPSSRKRKKDIVKFSGQALDLISKIEIVNFKFIDDDSYINHVGFIAEDTPEEFSGPNKDSMQISDCIGMLIQAIKELQEENISLKKQIEEKYGNGN